MNKYIDKRFEENFNKIFLNQLNPTKETRRNVCFAFTDTTQKRGLSVLTASETPVNTLDNNHLCMTNKSLKRESRN
ncbi:MAG: hypothetical protein O2871_03850 [bacterium]|nr:hypothetical protein [bacterium]